MKKAKPLFLDFDFYSDVGYTLRGILESCLNLGTDVQQEAAKDNESDFSDGQLSEIMAGCQPNLIFLVLSTNLLKKAEALFQSMKNVFLELPIVVVLEIGRPGAMFSLFLKDK